MEKKLIVVFVISGVLYSIIASTILSINIISILMPSVLLFVAVYNNCKKRFNVNKKILILYLLLFLLQLILLIYNAKYRNLPFTNVDWETYDSFAKKAINQSEGDFISIINKSADLFSGIVGLIYFLFNQDITIVYFYITPIAHITLGIVYNTIFILNKDRLNSSIGSILLFLYPANFIFSMSVLRETYIQFLISISVYNFIKFLNDRKINQFLIAIITIIFASLMHSGMIGILIIYIYIFGQTLLYKKIKYFRVGLVIITLTVVAILSVLPFWATITRRFNSVNDINSFINAVVSSDERLDGNTRYIHNTPKTISELLLTLPYRLIMYTMSPFPWQVYNIETLIALLVDGVLRYCVIFEIIKTLFRAKKQMNISNKYIIVLLLMIIITDIIFCLGVNNYGQAMRHRTKTLPLELILIYAFKLKKENRINEKN